MFYPKLIRDADKLDIWKVVTNYYNDKKGGKNKALELDLPESQGFSERVIQDLINQHPRQHPGM